MFTFLFQSQFKKNFVAILSNFVRMDDKCKIWSYRADFLLKTVRCSRPIFRTFASWGISKILLKVISTWKSKLSPAHILKRKKTRYELKLYWPSTIWASSPITPQCKYIYSVKTLEASENISQPPLWQTSVNVENTTSISKNTKSAGKIKCIWHSCIYKTTRNYVRGKEGLTIVKQVKLNNVLDFYLLQQVLLFIQGLILPL